MMVTQSKMAQGRRHTLAVAAFSSYVGGMSERDAVDTVLAGKPHSSHDREAIEAELLRLIESDAPTPTPEPVLAVVDDDGSREDDQEYLDEVHTDPDDDEQARIDADIAGSVGPQSAIVPPPGAAERRAEVERIAAGTPRAKGERRTLAVRLVDAKARRDAIILEVRGLELMIVAEQLDDFPAGKPAARMVVASVRAGFVSEAEPYARRGAQAIGLVLPDRDLTPAELGEMIAEVPRG